MTKSDQKVYTAIKRAVHAGISAVGGIEGVRKLSLFPSASKKAEGAKKAA